MKTDQIKKQNASLLDFTFQSTEILQGFLLNQQQINKAMADGYERQLAEKDVTILRQAKTLKNLRRKLSQALGVGTKEDLRRYR